MNENEYTIDSELLELLRMSTSEIVISNIYDNLSILSVLGFENVDDVILSYISGLNDDSNIIDIIKQKLIFVNVEVLDSLGIGTECTDLVTLTNLLITVSLMKIGDPNLSKLLLTILEDDEKNNNEILATLVSTHTNTDYVTAYDSVTYFKDIYYIAYKEYLNQIADQYEDGDTEDVDEDFNLMMGLIKLDSVMVKTDPVIRMMQGKEIKTNIEHYLKMIDDINDRDILAANLALGLYLSDETKEDPITGLHDYITDAVLTDTEDEHIKNMILGYLKKLMDNENG